MRAWMTAAVVAGSFLALQAQAAAADRLIATAERATTIDAYDGHAVWSSWDPDIGAYRLMAYHRGAVRAVRVPPNRVPFDVDLGPDLHGRTIAVFSRCARPPVDTWALDGRRGCDLYSKRLGGGRQVALRSASGPADEYWPTVWGGRLAFTRTYRPRGGRTRRLVYWRPLSSRRPSQRLRRGPTAEGDAIPEQLDMRGGRVTFSWRFEYGGQIRVADTRGGGRLVARVPGSGAAAREQAGQGPTLTRGVVDWMLAVGGDVPVFSEFRRIDLSGRDRRRATTRITAGPALARATEGFAQDGRASWYVRAAAADRFEIRRATGLRYEPVHPE